MRAAQITIGWTLGLIFAFAGALCTGVTATAEDWPAFRHDNARSAITPERLSAPLAQQWVFVPLHGPEPAWPVEGKEKDRVRFDEVFHVAAAGDAVYFASSADNKVYCLDAASGHVRWSTITGGPVRVAPTVANGRVYVGSDDGFAYCLQATDGSIVWKVRAAYRPDQVVGNGKMISLWPVRTGVTVDQGTAYFGAGVFPHESIFVCAVKAGDGTLVWRNDACGEEGYKQEFGGISPQGPMLASDKTVFVPSGRAMPAAFDKATGEFLYYVSPGAQVGGTWALLTEDRLVAGVESKRAYDMERGRPAQDEAYAWFPGTQLVVAKDYAYLLNFYELVALDRKLFAQAGEARRQVETERKPLQDRLRQLEDRGEGARPEASDAVKAERASLGKQIGELNAKQKQIEDGVHAWRRPCNRQDALVLAGDTLFMGGDGAVAAASTKNGEELWSAPVEGRACGLAVANGRLFVSTDKGRIYSFGKKDAGTEVKMDAKPAPFPDDDLTRLCAKAADQIVAVSGVKKGFCLVYGNGTGRLAYELAKRTDLRIVGVAVEPNVEDVAAARQALDAAGLYGTRVTIEQADPASLPYADYFANLVVSETAMMADKHASSPDEFLRVLKPEGGIVCVGRPEGAPNQELLPDAAKLRDWLSARGITASVETVENNGHWLKITRGALEGAGKWTHQYADSGNTACSDDLLVKGDLGTLWFGRPGPQLMVERHARAAAPVAMDGRMFIQGENTIMAYDAYNGVLLWEKTIPGALRVRVDSDMGNLALAKDGLYVAAEDKCYRLDPATGETIREYALPPDPSGKPKRWGYVACADGLLFGSSAPKFTEPYGEAWEEMAGENGEWRSIDASVEKRSELGRRQSMVDRFKEQYPKPDTRAFWGAQQAGVMWRAMSPWPAWGSVQRPQGAVTERIMASDVFFALDPATGEVRWAYRGGPVAHPAIAIGDGMVFLSDCKVAPEQKQAAMAERQTLVEKGVWEKETIDYEAQDADVRLVVALDAKTGQKRWERIMDLTGCGGDRMGLAYKDGVLCFLGCFSNHDREMFKKGFLAWRRITAVAGKDGKDMWSKPLNYLRRPVIVGDQILIEPRACDLKTGAVLTRNHPLTGAESEWEYVRPGHCCSATSAAPNMFFLRGYFLWYYDLVRDQGMQAYGGIRPGCWINVIPANGLVLFPEASAGCICSYPIRSTVVLEPKRKQQTWSMVVQHGKMTPVKHMAVNFGAPGDWRDEDGTLWFGYPHPPDSVWYSYGVNFVLDEKFLAKPAYFCRNAKGAEIKGTDKPWLFASGCTGLTSCALPLLGEGEAPATYTVRLYFAEPKNTAPGQRVFSVKLQDQTALPDFDIAAAAGGANAAVVKEFKGVKVTDKLRVELAPKKADAGPDEAPLINGIEVIREDIAVAKN